MTDLTVNIARRIKKHVWGQKHSFYANCAPGLEDLCAQELGEMGIEDLALSRGGLAFQGRLDLAYAIHLHSRLINRLLLRLKDFRIHNLKDFTTKLKAIPWELYLPANPFLRLQVDMGQSHLQHSAQLEEVLGAAINQRLAAFNPGAAVFSAQAALKVFLRTHQGRCTVSLDLSGQLMHKRGYRLNGGLAPLRETLAAALLRFCGWRGHSPLLDPMCGSGTLILEAAQIALNMAPGQIRDFSINHLPCHRQATWQHMLRKTRALSRQHVPAPILARDKSPLKIAWNNAKALNSELPAQIDWQQGDFFEYPRPDTPPGLMVINPPYGVRLGSVRQGRALMEKLARRFKEHYAHWSLGIILYRPEWRNFFTGYGMRATIVSHGGLKITMLHLKA